MLGERLRPPQWAAVALGAAGVLVVTIGYGGLPWVSLALAGSFGLYGLVKKRADVEAVPSLAIETGFAVPSRRDPWAGWPSPGPARTARRATDTGSCSSGPGW